jgi:isopentenyldiphosphate isomerase
MVDTEKIQVVDKDDKPTGGAAKPEVWKKGLVHRIVRIIVEDKKGRILLQKRSAKMQLYPSCWDQSAAGHVDEDESYETAAQRELFEELGINSNDLKEIGYYYWEGTFEWRKLNRFNKVYKVVVNNTPKNLGAGEVTEVKWFTAQEAKDLVKNHPDHVTDGLQQIMAKFY